MRQRFEQQTTMGITPVSEVKFPLRSRDELPPVLKALQHIFVTPELNEKIFAILEAKICAEKKPTGRKGMDLWHILVLAIVRHALDTNWDRLEHIANNDKLTRKILGVHVTGFEMEEEEFAYQTIADNVSLLDEKVLQEINLLVVQHGHNLLKKKEDEALQLKSDSFVLETNVHFPTDLNLLWDAGRKCLDVVGKLIEPLELTGWRKIKHLRREFKISYRNCSQKVFSKGRKNEEQIRQSVQHYLQTARLLQKRSREVMQTSTRAATPSTLALMCELKQYTTYLNHQMDLVERRLLKGETIPAEEKIHSIFEPHTEWITKGKMHPSVELGHLLLITTDQHHFILDYKVMENEKDAAQVVSLADRIQINFPDKTVYSHSFDKGFYSKSNYKALVKAGTENSILPKKGKPNKKEKAREGTKTFKALRNAHSAVESNINMLNHHGLNRCVDKGLNGYKRYVGLSVLAYNLHILGNHLTAVEREKEKRLQKQREHHRQAA
jgi:hypothetical protein